MTVTTASSLILVDSSAWVEYWGDGPKAAAVDPYFDREDRVLLPTIVVYEVFKKLLSTRGSSLADRFLSYAYRTHIVPLDDTLALASAENSLKLKLSMADAIIYATAQAFNADVVTFDRAFSSLPGVTML